jgi:poly-beta-1,6-N-acetyl-D-glucosamine synthase
MEDIILYNILVYVTSFFGLFTTIFFFYTLWEYRHRIKDPEVDLNKKEDTPFVSIVMPAFNEGKNIRKTVESVQNLNYPKDRMEIVLVDDGSTDDTLDVIKKMALKDSRIKGYTKPNGGTADAKNFGIKKSRGEFIVTLDSDSYVDKDALKNMIGYMRDKRVTAVTPSMSVYKPKGFLQNLQYVEYTLGIYLRKVFGLLNCIHVTPGPFSIYRKSFFEKYGYFETGNLTEDIEIALRMQKNGYKIENSIHAGVYTVAPNNFKALLNQRMRWYYGFVQNVLRNKDLFKPKYGYLALIMLPAAFISVALTILIFFYFIYKNLQFVFDKIIYVLVTKTNLFTVELKTLKMHYITDVLTNFITNPFILLAVVALILTIISIAFAKRSVRDKYKMFWPFVFFAFTYWFFYAVWWLAPFIWKAFGGKIRWGKKWY